MTPPDDASAVPDGPRPSPDDLVDGVPLEELVDYLDRGREPRDPRIEGSPACRLALQALQRVSELTLESLQHEADRDPGRDDRWISGLMGTIAREVVDGRAVPLAAPAPGVGTALTKAAVRGLLRRAGDAVDGVLVTATELVGDVTVPEAPVTVRLAVTVRYGVPLADLADALRVAVTAALARHTELNVVAVDVTIADVVPPAEEPGGAR